MSGWLFSIVRLSRMLGTDKNELINKLEKPSKRGFVLKLGRQYSQLMPLFVYDMPFILKENYENHKKETLKFAQLSRKFFEEENYYKTWQTSRKGIPRFRVLTVSEEVEPGREIVPIEEVLRTTQ